MRPGNKNLSNISEARTHFNQVRGATIAVRLRLRALHSFMAQVMHLHQDQQAAMVAILRFLCHAAES